MSAVDGDEPHAMRPNEVVYQQVEGSGYLGKSDEHAEEGVREVNGLESPSKLVDTLPESEHCSKGGKVSKKGHYGLAAFCR